MSLFNLITADGIIISEGKNLSVDDAIDISCSTLIERGKIEKRYIESIKSKHHKIGPYYVLAPKIAMPHARPEDGVIEGSLQLTIFKHGVDFGDKENGNVYLSMTLAASDPDNHIHTIMSLSELFQNEADIDEMVNATSINSIIEILKKY